MRFALSTIASLGQLLTATMAAGPVQAQPATWDQERVTALGEELRKAVSGVRSGFRNQPPAGIGSGQARSFYAIQDKLRVIESESRAFASALEKGQGHDQTVHMYERIQMLRRDAAEIARRLMLTEPVLDKIAAARDVLIRLAPYYDSTWKETDQPG